MRIRRRLSSAADDLTKRRHRTAQNGQSDLWSAISRPSSPVTRLSAAASRTFGDRSCVTTCSELTAHLRPAAQGVQSPVLRVQAVCRAYLDFPATRPHLYRVLSSATGCGRWGFGCGSVRGCLQQPTTPSDTGVQSHGRSRRLRGAVGRRAGLHRLRRQHRDVAPSGHHPGLGRVARPGHPAGKPALVSVAAHLPRAGPLDPPWRPARGGHPETAPASRNHGRSHADWGRRQRFARG